MSASGRGHFNWEMLDLWLGAYAGGYEGPFDDNKSPGRPKKMSSKMPINVLWMEANEDPKVRETDRLLRKIVLEQMPNEKPGFYQVIRYLYIREYANPAESERWRTATSDTDTGFADKVKYAILQKAKRWILREVQRYEDGFVLVVPDPIDPKGFVRRSRKTQEYAKRVYYESVRQHGDKEARRIASKATGYSLRHMRNLIPREEDNG